MAPNTEAKGVVLILEWQGHILLQLRDDNRDIKYPLCWALPGGGVEADETAPEAASRELQEEFGLEIKLEWLGTTTKGNAFFFARLADNGIPVVNEGSGYGFLHVDVIQKLMSFGTDRPNMIGGILATRVREYYPAFQAYVVDRKPLPPYFFF